MKKRKKSGAPRPGDGAHEGRPADQPDSTRPPQDRPQYADRPPPTLGGPDRRKTRPGEKPGSPAYGDTEPDDPRRPES